MLPLALARHLSIADRVDQFALVKLHLGLVKTAWSTEISFHCLYDYNTRNCAHGSNCFHLLEKFTFPYDISLPYPSLLPSYTRVHMHTHTHTLDTNICTCLAFIMHFFCLLIVFITIFVKAKEIMKHQDLDQKCE